MKIKHSIKSEEDLIKKQIEEKNKETDNKVILSKEQI